MLFRSCRCIAGSLSKAARCDNKGRRGGRPAPYRRRRARNNGRHELWKSPKRSRHAAAQANDRIRLVGCLYAGSTFQDEQRRCELGKPSMTYLRVFIGRRALLAWATFFSLLVALAQTL